MSFNIESNINILISKASNNRKKFLTFLETIPIIDDLSINNYVIKYLLENEKNNDYTYWIDGGFSWFFNYEDNEIDKIRNDELQLTSLSPLNMKIHYMYTDKNTYEQKKELIKNFLIELKKYVDAFGIKTNIIEKTVDRKELFKQEGHILKLVIDENNVSGGGKFEKKKREKLRFNPLKTNKELIFPTPLPQLKKLLLNSNFNIDDIKNKDFNGKVIVEFYLENFSRFNSDGKEFLKSFEKNYLNTTPLRKEFLKDFNELNISKLNRLNDYGLMTFSLLNKIIIEDEFNLNVENYRQRFFEQIYNIRQKNYKDIPPFTDFLKEILHKYEEVFKQFQTCYNTFFIENLKEMINKKIDPDYDLFKDVIDRWFVSKFRPSINSFIIEINKILLKILGVRLFIAGGDAMRRYENEISFTKDIDTKLYIGNINLEKLGKLELNFEDDEFKNMDEHELNEIIKKLKNIQLEIGKENKDLSLIQSLIKDLTVGIIVRHIVKLRNYLQENIKNIFQNLLQYDTRTDKDGFGTKVIQFKMKDNRTFKVDILSPPETITKSQQFRTRENKKRDDFPVDLYSIDFRIYIYDEKNGIINKKSHDISILDVVLQDSDDFHDYYITDKQGIPVASLDFLKEDIEKTFSSDRAYARISSGKVAKDISRYKKIKELYELTKKGGTLKIDNIDEIITNFNSQFSTRKDLLPFKDILKGLKENKTVDLIYIYANREFFKGNLKRHNQIFFKNQDLEYFAVYHSTIKKILFELYHNPTDENQINFLIKQLDLNSTISNLEALITTLPSFDKDIKDPQILLNFLNKLKTFTQLTELKSYKDIIKPLYDFNYDIINPIFYDEELQQFIEQYPELKLFFTDLFFFKKNFYNEDLSKLDSQYDIYNEQTSTDEIIKIYYPLFYNLCSIENKDGLVRHVIQFQNWMIKKMYGDHPKKQNPFLNPFLHPFLHLHQFLQEAEEMLKLQCVYQYHQKNNHLKILFNYFYKLWTTIKI